MTRPGIEPRSPGPLANTLTARPMSGTKGAFGSPSTMVANFTPGKGVAPSPIPWCSSYRKGSLRFTLDYGRQLYLLTSHRLMTFSNIFVLSIDVISLVQFSYFLNNYHTNFMNRK